MLGWMAPGPPGYATGLGFAYHHIIRNDGEQNEMTRAAIDNRRFIFNNKQTNSHLTKFYAKC
jgi:hypothetical protein